MVFIPGARPRFHNLRPRIRLVRRRGSRLSCYSAPASDAVRMGWQHVRGDEIAVRQQKTDEPLLIPMDQSLVQALAAAPRTNLTFLVTERGAPFTVAGFGNWFRDRCNEAGLPQCSAH